MYQKYQNKKVEIDGIKFDSKMESNIYNVIKDIRNIEYILQPKYLLQEKFRFNGKVVREINYIGDFDLRIGNELYTIDVKGMETPVFKLKAKMFLYKYNREIVKIKSIKQFKLWLKEKGVEYNEGK